MKTFFKDHLWKVTTVLFLMLWLAKGCTTTKIASLEKKYIQQTDSLKIELKEANTKISEFATKKEVRDQMEKVMLDFLIYEDDLDKGKTSLSQIKDKIESND